MKIESKTSLGLGFEQNKWSRITLAELCQAQVKLKAIVGDLEEVGIEVAA